MWKLALDFAVWIAGLCGFGKKDERDIAHDDGLVQGRAEQKAADQAVAIKGQEDVIGAQQRMGNVSTLSDDDALRRLRDGTA